jgi:hypothetical protein
VLRRDNQVIQVRFVFHCKWGKAGEVAELMSESISAMAESLGAQRVSVLTDLSGPFNRVVQEIEVESLAEWEAARAKAFQRPEFLRSQEKMAKMIESGSAEFYTIEH